MKTTPLPSASGVTIPLGDPRLRLDDPALDPKTARLDGHEELVALSLELTRVRHDDKWWRERAGVGELPAARLDAARVALDTMYGSRESRSKRFATRGSSHRWTATPT
jgi:hypothetical protein